MKKIVLVGELNEIVRGLNECLSRDFQVQLCNEKPESVQGIVSIAKPYMVIISQISMETLDCRVLEWLNRNYTKKPILIISTSEKWEEIKPYCEGQQYHKMFRPISQKVLLKKCSDLLNKKKHMPTIKDAKSKKKILIIDDSPLVLRNMKSILEKKYILYLATSGEQGLSMVLSKEPDLVLLDYEMPGMDGRETFEAMLDDDFAKDIPVIFLTSVARREQIYDVLKSNPAGYILKPPEKENRLSTIEEVLQQYSS